MQNLPLPHTMPQHPTMPLGTPNPMLMSHMHPTIPMSPLKLQNYLLLTPSLISHMLPLLEGIAVTTTPMLGLPQPQLPQLPLWVYLLSPLPPSHLLLPLKCHLEALNHL